MWGTFFSRGLCRHNPRGGWSIEDADGARSMEEHGLLYDGAASEVVDRRRHSSRLPTAFWFIHALLLLLSLPRLPLLLLLLAALRQLLVISVAFQKVCPKRRQHYSHWATTIEPPSTSTSTWGSQMLAKDSPAASMNEWDEEPPLPPPLGDRINEIEWRGSECVPAKITSTFDGQSCGQVISQDHTGAEICILGSLRWCKASKRCRKSNK